MEPVKFIVSKKSELKIDWSDNIRSVIPLTKLRENCPCAFCMEDKSKQSKTYIPLWFGEQIEIVKLELIGTYGLKVAWKDGHNTGIYEIKHLRRLGGHSE